jgi:hypothetical protein
LGIGNGLRQYWQRRFRYRPQFHETLRRAAMPLEIVLQQIQSYFVFVSEGKPSKLP